VSKVIWPTICEIVKAAPGFICPKCIASSVALPSAVVIMATLGLSRVDGFETAEGTCARCGTQGRVIRTRPSHAADRSL